MEFRPANWDGGGMTDGDLAVDIQAGGRGMKGEQGDEGEYTAKPSARQQKMGQLAIDAGADVVVGAHPHWVQAMEWYKGKPIFYSLGNFIFDQNWSAQTSRGAVGLLRFKGSQLAGLDFIPVVIEYNSQPRLAKGWDARAVMSVLGR